MEKVTDRILWSILVLAIGVSIFVFGKPAFVKLTNQVLHRDDLKATMQTPSTAAVSSWNLISTDGEDNGVSSHAYVLKSTSTVTPYLLWNGDARQVLFPKEIRQTPIPYNSYVKVIFKVKVDKATRTMLDISNHPVTGNGWNGNDNDSKDKRVLLLDNNSIPYNQGNLSAGTWHTIEMEYENTASANTQHITLFDDSGIDFINDTPNDVNVQIKDFVFAVDNVKYR